jgi:hypothetical protein
MSNRHITVFPCIIPVKRLFDDRGLYRLQFVRPLSDDEVKKLDHMQRNEVSQVSQRADMILSLWPLEGVVAANRLYGTLDALIDAVFSRN